MRDFGLGKHSIDERIQDEARVLVEIFRQKRNTAFDPQDALPNLYPILSVRLHLVKSTENIKRPREIHIWNFHKVQAVLSLKLP